MLKYNATVQQLFSLENKVVFISGASGHLGSAMAEILVQFGANLIINGRNKNKLANLKEKLKKHERNVEIACFDITNEKEVKTFFSNVSRLDVLINNAYSGVSGSIEYIKKNDFINSYNITVISAFNAIKYSKNSLLKAVEINGDASIVNIASMYGMISPDIRIYKAKKMANPPMYGAAKAALIQLTKYCACELAENKIRVNAITPGAFPSEEVKQETPVFIKKLANKIPLQRIGNPSEIQGPLIYLASKASLYVTGTNVVVDGGWTIW